jgi:hypothetical protein
MGRLGASLALVVELDLGLQHPVEVAVQPGQLSFGVIAELRRKTLRPVVNHDLHDPEYTHGFPARTPVNLCLLLTRWGG